MTPTADLRTKLRKLINETIPIGKTEDETLFSDEEINDLITEAASIEAAAAEGWTQKAGKLQTGEPATEGYSAGQETYKLTSLKDRVKMCLDMAAHYRQLAIERRGKMGSLMLHVERPEVT
jgi:hypothetical protein